VHYAECIKLECIIFSILKVTYFLNPRVRIVVNRIGFVLTLGLGLMFTIGFGLTQRLGYRVGVSRNSSLYVVGHLAVVRVITQMSALIIFHIILNIIH
jgi:hypothetical protein